MTPDPELRLATTLATTFFAAVAIFAPLLLMPTWGKRRFTPPPRALVLIFRLWFGALALGCAYLTLFGRAGFFPR